MERREQTMAEKLASENSVDLTGLEPVKTVEGNLVFAPPRPEPVVEPIQIRDTRIVPGQLADQSPQKPLRAAAPSSQLRVPELNDRVSLPKLPGTVNRRPSPSKQVKYTVPAVKKTIAPPENPHAEKSTVNRRHAGVIGTIVVCLASGLAWAGHEFMQEPPKKTPVVRANLAPPLVENDKNTPSVPTSDPSATIDLTGVLATPEEDPTTQQSAAPLSPPTSPQILVPPAAAGKPSSSSITESSPASSSAAPSSSSHAAPSPRSTTPVVAPPSAETPAPTSTTEQTKPRELATAPSAGAVEALRSLVRSGDIEYYTNEYSNLGENLDLEQLARDGELKNLTVSGIRGHQRNLSAEYADSAVAGILGEPAWLSETRLRELRSNGQNASDRLLAFTDNLLNKSAIVYPITGKSIADVPYLNDKLSSDLTEKLHTGVNPSVGDAEDTHLLAVKTAEIKDGKTVALAAVIGTYHKGDETINTFRWDVLEPINNLGEFVGVTIVEKELNAAPAATTEPEPSPTSTISEESQPTATDTSYSQHKDKASDRQKSKRHDDRHRR